MRKTRADAERTRDEILDAAESIFFDKGVARTTLEDIARAAGVTRGAVYWHFRNKVDLFEAMHVRSRLPQEDLVAKIVADPTLDPLSELERAAMGALTTFAGDEKHKRVLAILMLRCEYTEEMEAALKRQRQANAHMRGTLLRIFELARERGLLAPAWRPESASLALCALMLGLIREWLERPDEVGLGTAGVEAARGFFAGLRADAASPCFRPAASADKPSDLRPVDG